jgi:hypothetical protein
MQDTENVDEIKDRRASQHTAFDIASVVGGHEIVGSRVVAESTFAVVTKRYGHTVLHSIGDCQKTAEKDARNLNVARYVAYLTQYLEDIRNDPNHIRS